MNDTNLNLNLTPAQLHEHLRKQCWIQVVAGVSSANNCSESTTAIKWGDKILQRFDEKFPTPPSTTKQEA